MPMYVNKKKPHYIICYEGGACGNFIASLIRTMASPTYYDTHGNFTSRGSCDHMSGGQRLSYDYMYDVVGHASYPETEHNVNCILHGLANPEKTYEKLLTPDEREFDFHLTTIHYFKPSTIKRFLKNKNVYVIYVSFKLTDISLIAYNFIYKITEKERERETVKWGYFKELLTEFNRPDKLEELEKTNYLYEISASLLETLMNCHILKADMFYQIKASKELEPNDRLIKMPFDLIYSNKDAILQMLSDFTNFTVNESTHRLYDDYMLAQEPILNKFKK